ncbi:Alpha/Beta hydrolase protein [Irpex lacteus]|nr:Alpha/Beta hydrolase protein [Irpex lacteus]
MPAPPEYQPLPHDGGDDVEHYPPQQPRPAMYYGEGEFDPPSSDDEEDSAFIEKQKGGEGERDGAALEEDGELVVGGKNHRRPSSLRCLVFSLLALVTTAVLIGIFAAFSYRGTSYQVHGSQHLTMDHVFNGTFSPVSGSVRWVPEAGDGVYATNEGGRIKLVDLKSDNTTDLVALTDVRDQWRHSSFGNYYIHDLSTHTTVPLIPPTHPPEVFSADYALWWSPDSAKVAYLSFDETQVDEFTFPVYNPTENSYEVVPYPGSVSMKYPKPGYSNPLVSVHVFELDRYYEAVDAAEGEAVGEATLELTWEGRLPLNDSVIAEVAWVANGSVLLKEVNRAGNNGSIVLFDLEQGVVNFGRTTRRLGRHGEQGDDGWIDSSQSITPLPQSLTPGDGYNHIALFSPASEGTPHSSPAGAGKSRTTRWLWIPYFRAANPHSTQRHLFSIPSPPPQQTSPSPTQAKSNRNRSRTSRRRGTLTRASRLATLLQYELPVVTYSTIESDGYELNVREIRPPRMDDSGKTKYPVLFQVYGGPFSQQVDVKYSVNFHHYLAATHKYVVVTVDGRGTGWKGRKLRNPVKDQLGYYETIDQINAAKIWAAKDYVDDKRIGIWGWSYGGFMSCKVAEANAGVHTLAMAVAVVIIVFTWTLSDSIYTERYMDVPDVNPEGYVTASISNVTGFHNIDFLFAHGSADDNVHYANSAHLLDMLTREQVRDFRFRMFTDSDHSIYRRGANREVYEYLLGFLVEKWGKGPRQRGW